jgi:hypothetical protein
MWRVAAGGWDVDAVRLSTCATTKIKSTETHSSSECDLFKCKEDTKGAALYTRYLRNFFASCAAAAPRRMDRRY